MEISGDETPTSPNKNIHEIAIENEPEPESSVEDPEVEIFNLQEPLIIQS
jgi:hypothetical protein